MEQASPFQPAIDELEKELQVKERGMAELERDVNALLATLNLLRSRAGQLPRPSGFARDGNPSGDEKPTAIPVIRHDSFFGKKMSTSAREFLDMRRAVGPARVKEIFEALKQGGYHFETKDDETAQASLRSLMSKYTVIFQKLPNGTWGLKSWYPDAKKAKSTTKASAHAADEIVDDDAIPTPDETGEAAEAA